MGLGDQVVVVMFVGGEGGGELGLGGMGLVCEQKAAYEWATGDWSSEVGGGGGAGVCGGGVCGGAVERGVGKECRARGSPYR